MCCVHPVFHSLRIFILRCNKIILLEVTVFLFCRIELSGKTQEKEIIIFFMLFWPVHLKSKEVSYVSDIYFMVVQK